LINNDLDLSSFDGCLSMKLVDCGDWICGMLEWEIEAHLEQSFPKQIAFLDTFIDSLEEISPELGVTDPISGSVVIDA